MTDSSGKEWNRLKAEKVAFQAQRKLLEKFVSMARSPNKVEMMKKTLKKSVEVAVALTGADKGSLFLLDDEGVVTDSILARGESPSAERFEIIGSVLDGGLAGWVSRNRKMGLVTDTDEDERWLTLPGQPYEVKSALAVPILRGEELFGILTLLHSKSEHFNQENADLMQITANQMDLALENVRLYEKLEASNRSLDEAKKAAEAYSKALNDELEKGRKIQKDFLPTIIPDITDWEIKARFLPAVQVAGDFYDVFNLPGNYLGLVIADVCDKGIGSALYMALLRSLVRIFSGQTALSGLSIDQDKKGIVDGKDMIDADQARPLQAISLTNNYLLQNHEDMGMFATMFFGVLNTTTGSLAYINAGHLSPIIVGSDGIKKVLGTTAPFVGLMPDVAFEIKNARIDPGDILVGYTDGVTEAISADGDFFTQKHLDKIVAKGNKSAADMISTIETNLSEFTGNVPQSDDITILAVLREK